MSRALKTRLGASPRQAADRDRQWKLIAELRAQGKTNREIAQRLGWGADAARVGAQITLMRRAGLQIDDRRPATPETIALRKATAVLMWEDGLPVDEIAETLEISQRACHSMLVRMRGRWRNRAPPRASLV